MLAELAEGSRKDSYSLLDTRAPRVFYRSRPAGSHASFLTLRSGSLPRPAHRAPHHFCRGVDKARYRAPTPFYDIVVGSSPAHHRARGYELKIVERLAPDACGLLHCWGHRLSHSSVASAAVPGATSRARCYAKIFAVVAYGSGFSAAGRCLPSRFVRPEKENIVAEKKET